MNIEIDQSGKIEETHRDAILAFSNGKSKMISISARTKRKLQDVFRQIGRPKDFIISTFTIAIFLLIKDDLKQINQIVIDIEYPGYEKLITKILDKIFLDHKVNNQPDILFSLVGRESRSHIKAITVFRKKQKADKVLTYQELHRETFNIKNRRPVLKHLV